MKWAFFCDIWDTHCRVAHGQNEYIRKTMEEINTWTSLRNSTFRYIIPIYQHKFVTRFLSVKTILILKTFYPNKQGREASFIRRPSIIWFRTDAERQRILRGNNDWKDQARRRTKMGCFMCSDLENQSVFLTGH